MVASTKPLGWQLPDLNRLHLPQLRPSQPAPVPRAFQSSALQVVHGLRDVR